MADVVPGYLGSLPTLSVEQVHLFLQRIEFTEDEIDSILSKDRTDILENAATLENLKKLQGKSTLAIPFEQLDVALARKIFPEKAFEKIVVHGRGGYCFENNTLMLQILKAIGYNVRAGGGRVIISRIAAQTHLVSIVTFCTNGETEEYLVDIGVGGQTPRAPINISHLDQAFEIYPDVYRLIKDSEAKYYAKGALILQYYSTYLKDFKNLFVFHPNQVVHTSDVECSNFYVSQFIGPGNWFTTTRLAVRQLPDGRKALSNDKLVIHKRSKPLLNGDKICVQEMETDELVIDSDDQYFRLLKEEFSISLSWDTESNQEQTISMESFTATVLANRFK